MWRCFLIINIVLFVSYLKICLNKNGVVRYTTERSNCYIVSTEICLLLKFNIIVLLNGPLNKLLTDVNEAVQWKIKMQKKILTVL